MIKWLQIFRRSPAKFTSVSKHTWAVTQALFVTLLWASSYVLITIGLEEIPALTFAGLRYAIAAAVLLPLFLYRGQHRSVRILDQRDLGLLLLLGLFMYTATQGAQFAALQYIPAATVSLILSFTPAVVALLALPMLDESPSLRQWIWLGVLFLGVCVYFYPFNLRTAAVLGLTIMVIGLFSNSFSAILGRRFNRDETLSPLAITTVSMGFGSAVLLTSGITVQGLPSISFQSWAIVIWLAVVNTAFAFTLWNRTLQTLTATESSVINNTMLVQVAIFGWIFLGQTLDILELAGLVLVMVGAIAVQIVD